MVVGPERRSVPVSPGPTPWGLEVVVVSDVWRWVVREPPVWVTPSELEVQDAIPADTTKTRDIRRINGNRRRSFILRRAFLQVLREIRCECILSLVGPNSSVLRAGLFVEILGPIRHKFFVDVELAFACVSPHMTSVARQLRRKAEASPNSTL